MDIFFPLVFMLYRRKTDQNLQIDQCMKKHCPDQLKSANQISPFQVLVCNKQLIVRECPVDLMECVFWTGMGVTTITAARILKGQLQKRSGEETVMNMDTFPYVGLAKVTLSSHRFP